MLLSSARREFRRLGVNLPLQERQGPREKEEVAGSEGARLKSADVGVDRFGLSRGPSAALRRIAPEERPSNGRSRRFDLAHRTEPVEVERVPRGSLAKQVSEGSLGLVSHAKIHVRKRGFHSLGGRHLFLDFRPDPLK